MKYTLKLSICLLLLFAAYGSNAATVQKTVAVLPFAVHSAENIDYVKHGIWDMLASRIAVPDKIEVVSKDTVMQALKAKEGKDLSSADVYGLGKKMNVDFVVHGSITKIGNSISIDGKLVDIAANKSTVSLFTQSQGMDEVILKINDFAKNIDNKILGIVPSTFASTPSPAGSPTATQQQVTKESHESEIVGGLRKSKRGTYTAVINPDFITSPRPVDRKGFWMSPKFSTEFRGMDIGDVTGDGQNKVVIIDIHNVMIYLKRDKDFTLVNKIPGKSSDNYIAVDVADINGSGVKQIFVTSMTHKVVESFVLEYRDGKFVKIADKLPWFMRVIERQSGPVLIGQTKGMDKPLGNPIYELRWQDGKYRQGKRMPIPQGLSVYGLAMDDLGTGGEKVIAIDNYDYLNLYLPTEKSIEALKALGSVPERLWRSDDYFGGSNTVIVDDDAPPENENKFTFINSRILTQEIGKEHKKELVIVRNMSSVGRVLKNVKVFTSSEVCDLEWDGIGLVENWKTRKISGYVADYQLKDIDNDGQKEIVLALVLSTGGSLAEQSVIVAYRMTAPQPQEQQPNQ
ncbi:MAG TPA: FG-GAP-like repeat-containing protein [Syntrophales bacterium]|nr:FG-GAP-like repeat-containing protein [Syntrophales bacterium]